MTKNSRSHANVNTKASESRWSDLKALFDSALSIPPEERESFLESRCGPNQELRDELESLLLAYEQTGDFLEEPVASLGSLVGQMPEPDSDDATLLLRVPPGLLAGERIGPYQLEREIGRGGMGAVFLASRVDGEFEQQVAIKLIRHGAESDFAIRRFRHERQILAKLDHPFIARLLDGGTTEGGMPYFVMEYVDGRHITNYCDEAALDQRERIDLFLKVCSAVRYAHERNVIHRDLKPGNILVKNDHSPKLLDFGIAKWMTTDAPAGADATLAGFRMLTPAYASPEQMRGQPATVRSDIYSLGIILYELLSGERPSLAALQRNKPDTSHPQEEHLSPELRSVVFQAIQWDPDHRYASVQEFAEDLERYRSGAAPRASLQAVFEPEDVRERTSLAILPLRSSPVATDECSFLCTGIADALISRLSRVERLSVRPSSATLKYIDRRDTAAAARELKVRYILEGSVHCFGGRVQVGLQLVYAEASVAIWAAQFDEPADDLMKLEHEIAEEVASAVLPHLTGEERAQLSRAGTANNKAHEAYLRGRWHWTRSAGDPEQLSKALLCFSQAIEADQNYALAHAGLADYYLRLGLWGGLPPRESFSAAMKCAQRAVELDSSCGEAHASLGFAYWALERNFHLAEQHFSLAIIRNPDYGTAHHWFGLLNSARNEPALAIANLERARQVEPNSPVIVAALGFVHYNARQFERAVSLLDEAARELRNSAVVQEMMAWCYLKMGQHERALNCAHHAVALSGRSPSALAVLAHAAAAHNDRSAAIVLCEEIAEIGRKRYVSAYERASAQLATGNKQEAIRSLEQALADGDWWVSWIGVEPRWDSLREDPGFRRLIQVAQPQQAVVSEAPIRRRNRVVVAAAAIAIVLIAVWMFTRDWSRSETLFSNLRTTKITGNGIAYSAAISPDGAYIAYTTNVGGDWALWVRDVGTGRTLNIAPHVEGNISSLDFTRNGKALSFVNFASERPFEQTLFTVPVTGGPLKKELGPFSAAGAMSPDGTQAVTYERMGDVDRLWIHDLRTGNKRELKRYRYPERFAWVCKPAWSPDGRTIAYAAEQRDSQGFLVSLFAVDVATGRVRAVPSPRWNWVEHMAWAGKYPGLGVVGQERDSPFRQIWYIPLRGAAVRRIGNDLDNYLSVSFVGDGSAMVSVQVQTASNIYISAGSNLGNPRQVTAGSGRYFDLSWTHDGKILYASDATGSADLWMMNADGSGQRQIISGFGRSYAPIMTKDGRYVVFHSNRSGNWQIWRVNADGNDPKQLSQSSRDGNWPQLTFDSRFVLFHQTDVNGSYNLWRVPIAGGRPVRLTTDLTMHPATSPKDGSIASWWSATVNNPRWKLATFAPEGGAPQKVFTPTSAVYPDTTIRWTTAGDAITYLDHAKGASNIWLQPLDGSAPRQLTHFNSGEIYSFDWSPDNKLLYSRGMTNSDVVLIRDSRVGSGRPSK